MLDKKLTDRVVHVQSLILCPAHQLNSTTETRYNQPVIGIVWGHSPIQQKNGLLKTEFAILNSERMGP